MRLHSLTPDRDESHVVRLSMLVALLIILSLTLILRLAYLQFSQYKRYATLSLKNQMSILPIAPPRGIILDRHGVILADNMPIFVLELIPERIKNLDRTLLELQSLLPSITQEDIQVFQHERRQNHGYTPIPLKLKLTQEDVAIFSSNQHLFPGATIKARLMRYYPLGEMAAHVLGYVGRINEQEMQKINNVNYRASQYMGKTGIEKYYEDVLHGQVGYQQIETDVSGRTARVLSKQLPIAGSKLVLTLDIRLQKVAYDLMKNKRGAVVAINVRNGEILAMVSAPSFDPNLFVNGVSQEDYRRLLNAQDRPLYHRAVRGLYPPASTVKPFMALAGLEKGVITPDTTIYDPGWYKLPGVSHRYRDWKHTGHGSINLQRAITVSCDTYFYQLGNKIGISSMAEMLSQFGYGQLTQIDLQEEAPGLLPNATWKRQAKGAPWYPGDTLITAIGQGFMLASPLQMANATAALSQHGQRFRPHLLQKTIHDKTGTHRYQPVKEHLIQLRDKTFWTMITDAMKLVITSTEGTAHRFGRHAPYEVAGKTGTAQVFSGHQYDKVAYSHIPEALRDHSLFIAFAPVEQPEIAIAVMVEHDVIAAAIAREVLDAYFKDLP